MKTFLTAFIFLACITLCDGQAVQRNRYTTNIDTTPIDGLYIFDLQGPDIVGVLSNSTTGNAATATFAILASNALTAQIASNVIGTLTNGLNTTNLVTESNVVINGNTTNNGFVKYTGTNGPQGNGGGLTNLSFPTPTTYQTNWVLNTFYTNTNAYVIHVIVTFDLNNASGSPSGGMIRVSNTGWTAYTNEAYGLNGASGAENYQQVTDDIGPGGVFFFTNALSGAGIGTVAILAGTSRITILP